MLFTAEISPDLQQNVYDKYIGGATCGIARKQVVSVYHIRTRIAPTRYLLLVVIFIIVIYQPCKYL